MGALHKAGELGTQAFADGRSSTPIHDPALWALLESERTNLVDLMSAWSSAWHKANLAAPL